MTAQKCVMLVLGMVLSVSTLARTRCSSSPLAELGDPAVQHVRLLLERELFHRAARGGLELHRVRAISPIESDVHRDVLFMLHGPSGSGTHAWLRPAQAL